MIKRAIVILLLFLFLSGCEAIYGVGIAFNALFNVLPLNPVRMEPEQLPNAIVGMPYHVEVKILSGVPGYNEIEIIPKDALNLKWKKVDGKYSVEIYGTPQKKGVIKVKFTAYGRPTMVGTTEYNSTHKIIVKEQ